ncbi:hypothetical protein VTH06DRAFT_8411 [Thermothelomyces fergusii]
MNAVTGGFVARWPGRLASAGPSPAWKRMSVVPAETAVRQICDTRTAPGRLESCGIAGHRPRSAPAPLDLFH